MMFCQKSKYLHFWRDSSISRHIWSLRARLGLVLLNEALAVQAIAVLALDLLQGVILKLDQLFLSKHRSVVYSLMYTKVI